MNNAAHINLFLRASKNISLLFHFLFSEGVGRPAAPLLHESYKIL
jgi:hypothetical protein